MKKIKVLIVLLLSCLFIIGCANQRILERIGLVTLVGYDVAEENKVTATSVIRQINPELQSKVEVQSETESTSKGTRVKVDMKTSKKLAAGQMRVLLFGEDLAKKGIEEAIHTTMMNNEISTSIYLAVVKGSSKSLLEYPYKDVTDVGQHIYNLIDHNIKQQHTVSSTLHEVVRDNYSEVRNFALPILHKKGEFIEIDGVAFFSHGKMVGSLPAGDNFYILMMQDNFKESTLELVLDGESIDASKFQEKQLQIAVDSVKTKRSIKVVDPELNEFDLNIDFKCRLLEINSLVPINDPKLVEKMEKAVNQKIENEVSRILEYSQEINSDIYGFGEQYRAHVRGGKLTDQKWREKFREMKVNINVDVEIIRNGVFE
ncbi:Ger(x)C family spore germination protein [Ureibacillus aquaedulcis]|uniref:Ger(X)C family spore germination protein n=1 Tax=Ureibacillus aquaedulcis TaxID=3058421 RepID=A0ABT8GMC0_9BACL|nr:Ger(x)C family spore germination protein [Ureibacillus sp. BA0131]MDN4492570.1 Ger(x)C family spore germination protein [Ureibacillus sp. BA0131]